MTLQIAQSIVLMRIPICILILCFGHSSSLYAQRYERLRASVVEINTLGYLGLDKDNAIKETGAGIIIGSDQNDLFVLTAADVVKDKQQIELTFYKEPLATVLAKVLKQDTSRNIALLQMLKPGNISWIPFEIANAGDLQLTRPVLSIGHPYNNTWKVNMEGEVRGIADPPDDWKFYISSTDIAPGCSGGPVLNVNDQLLGLITEINSIQTTCIKTDELLKLMQDWGVPFQLSDPNPNIGINDTPIPDEEKPNPEKEKPNPEKSAFQQYLDWKNQALPSIKERDARLKKLETDYRHDYRPTLERIRIGIYGKHSHDLEFKLLKLAAEKAIINDDAENMLHELQRDKGKKQEGFWKLANAHGKYWLPVLEALEHKDVRKLPEINHH